MRLLRWVVLSLAFSLAFSLAVTAEHATAAPGAPPAMPPATTQLPRGIEPLHYDVAIVPHAAELRFDGRVAITLDVLAPARRITLNAAALTFTSARLGPVDRTRPEVEPTRITVDAAAETASFDFAQPIAPGRYRLDLVYAGVIQTQPQGLFAIDYGNDGDRQRALYTKFEAADARRFIPSWDEPAYKATFTLEATVPAALMALGNMPVESTQSAGNGLKRVRFATTPRMSTYLLFFGVGDFERITAREGATEVGIVTRRGASSQAAFALESTRRILRSYNEYFGLPYPLPKLDNIASPGSSRFYAAMENWGAIQSFETALLLDPAIAGQSERQRVFAITTHEIAHQWFGDLVTMRWWDDIWLNEGFASWITSRVVEELHPEWDTRLRAVPIRAQAMELDALQSAHPIVQHVETVDQVSQVFDRIIYAKGASVLAMLEAYVGADTWREGVRRYLKAHAYGNAVSDDFWHQMDRAAGKPIAGIARDFTRQPGVPLLRVERSNCVDGRTTLELTQGEFSADHPGKAPLRWRIPVIARSVGGAAVRTLVGAGTTRLVVPGCGAVIVNAGQSGYYRTWYAPAPAAALRDAFTRLDTIDQLGALDDRWALGLAGTAPIGDALELVARVPVDADPALWSSIADRLDKIDGVSGGDAPRQSRWRAYAIARLAPVLARIGWQAGADEATPVTVLRGRLIEILGSLGDPATIAEARRRHAARDSDPAAYPPALRRPILAVVARHADGATWDALHAAAQGEASPAIKDRLYRLLSAAEDEALARRALDLAMSDEPGPTNMLAMISEVAEEHPGLAFDFAVAHRDRVQALLGSSAANRYYPLLVRTSFDPATIDKLRRFADEFIDPRSRLATERSIATVGYRATVARLRLGEIDRWLEARRP